jgi:hypothetical protein
VIWKLRQKDGKFQARLGYIERLYFETTVKKKERESGKGCED